MRNVVLFSMACVMGLSYDNVFADCDNMSGLYSYTHGGRKGKGVMIQQSQTNMTMLLRWYDQDEYLLRLSRRHDGLLVGDWAQIRNNGDLVDSPLFRRYEGQIDPSDCSFSGTDGAVDPDGYNINLKMSPVVTGIAVW